MFIIDLHPEANCLSRRMNLENNMLYTIAVVLFVLWLLGMVSSYTLGGFIHIFLIASVVMLIVNIIGGRRTP